MSVPVFLLLIFGFFAVLGVTLAQLGFWRLYWAFMVGIGILLATSFAIAWRPQTDDPIPALMFLVIGVYGSIAGSAGMLTGLVLSKAISSRGRTS